MEDVQLFASSVWFTLFHWAVLKLFEVCLYSTWNILANMVLPDNTVVHGGDE